MIVRLTSPAGVTEELIVDTLSRVGQVLNFRLVYDQQTGKPKGFGFAEFSDPDAAASAVRNLNDTELMGRKLRVDWSNDGGKDESASTSYGAQQQQPQNVQDGAAQPSQSSALPPLPPGTDVPPNLTCPDAISRTLNTLPAPQLLDILSQMKGLVMSDPVKATELLRQAPQLSYAIFQSLLLLGLVDTSVLATVVDQASLVASAAAAPPTIPTPQIPPPIPSVQPGMQHQPYAGYPSMAHPGMVPTPPVQQAYQPPPPPQQQVPPQFDRDALIRQVLAMTPAQIDALPPAERQQLIQIRQSLLMQQGAQVY